MTLTSGSIEGKQLSLCRGNIIFCHVDFFCLQGKKRKMKREVFSDSYTEATTLAISGDLPYLMTLTSVEESMLTS